MYIDPHQYSTGIIHVTDNTEKQAYLNFFYYKTGPYTWEKIANQEIMKNGVRKECQGQDSKADVG